MTMTTIDWIIVFGGIAGLILVAYKTNKICNTVSDFLAANRCGRRYLLTMAEGMSTLGAISIVAYFEQFYQSGFAAQWWSQMLTPVGMIIALSGWVIYRFRETRAMTMAQFFEIRYSQRFRIFSGIVAWISGVINFGIFPAIGARLIIYLTGMPIHTCQLGPLSFDITLGLIMFVLLGIAVFLTFSGGQITIMVTDFLQGQFCNIIFLVILAFLLINYKWSDIIEGLQMAPPEKSLINPFKQGDIPEFNFAYFAILAFTAFYGYLAWQGGQGFNCSAISPHEARMAKILGCFRAGVTGLIIMLLPVVVFAILHNPKFSNQAQTINSALNTITDAQIRIQQRTPVALSLILPKGLLGLFVAVCIAAAISNADAYLHSWGSIFIQDVILPFHKKKLPQHQHIKWIKYSVLFVACFAWLFSMVFPLKEYIFMFFQITGAIYIGGAGAVIIGGLYWKRGTTAAAWTAMVTGSMLSVSTILVSNIFWPLILSALQKVFIGSTYLNGLTPDKFPINGAWLSFYCSVAAISVYVVVSLLTCKVPYNMDKLLHRGEYAITGEHLSKANHVKGIFRALGMGKEFTKTDRGIYILNIAWIMFLFLPFFIGTIYCLSVRPFNDSTWIKWWSIVVFVTAVVGTASTIWFLWGGFRNLKQFYHDLRTSDRDETDDGIITAPLKKLLDVENN